MKIVLFAHHEFGTDIARVLGRHNVLPTAVVVLPTHPAQEELLRVVSPGQAPPPELIEADDNATLEGRLRDMSPDLGILAWWPRILTQQIIDLFRIGVLNFHPSLLPYNRGKDPNFWSLRDRTPIGVTIHFIDAGVDTGPIAFQRELDATWEDTGGSIYDRTRRELIELFEQNLPAISEGNIPRNPQPPGGTNHLRRELDPASRIDLDSTYTGRQLLDLVRARTFAGHPGAWFIDHDELFEVRLTIARIDDAALIRQRIADSRRES